MTSAAYRQSSKVTPALVERDPENRLLARGPRFRLPSWMIRDQALGGRRAAGREARRPVGEAVSAGRASGKKRRSARRRTCRTTARRCIAAACTSSGGGSSARRCSSTSSARQVCTVKTLAHEHAAARADDAERRDLRRSGPGLGRASAEAAAAALPTIALGLGLPPGDACASRRRPKRAVLTATLEQLRTQYAADHARPRQAAEGRRVAARRIARRRRARRLRRPSAW